MPSALKPDRRPVWFLLGLLLSLNLWSAAAQSKTRASLLLAAEAARPGETVLAAVRLQMARGWHTYWRNPGDSGMATSIAWKLPPGVTAGDLQWPAPERHVADDLTTYVYHGEVLLLVPLQIGPSFNPGRLELKAQVNWLECEVACVPGGAPVTATLEIAAVARPSANAGLISEWQKRIPKPDPALEARARWEAPPAGDTANLTISGKSQPTFQPADFYAYASEDYEVGLAVRPGLAAAGEFALIKSVRQLGKGFPTRIQGLLVQGGAGSGPVRAVEATLDLPGAGGAPAGPAPASAAPIAAASSSSHSLLAMLGLAFLGGLILNIMPCVLPVIALKVLGFVSQSKEAPAHVRKLGLVYALGVLVSFLVLAGIVIQVQQAGGAASWGMQMQNPYFRFALLVVVTLVSLNLFGLFEFSLPGSAMGAAAGLASREGAAGAFFNGVLATALATPCTAPFLAVALGFAFTQPAWVIIAIFTAVALGLASPYVLLSWQPGWLKFVPKAGPWMLKFKVIMGFPMLATAVWLFDLTAPSFGSGGVLWLGLFLVLLGLAAWVWGTFVQAGTNRRALAAAVVLGLLAFAYGFVLEGQLDWRTPAPASTGTEVIRDSAGGIPWHRWSPAAVEQARKEGHPVLVDFTAKWCLTCKSNKRLAVDVPEVRAQLEAMKAVAFRADNTDPTPLITGELQRYHRAGVPLVLVFPADVNQPAIVLPEILTKGIVLAALVRAKG